MTTLFSSGSRDGAPRYSPVATAIWAVLPFLMFAEFVWKRFRWLTSGAVGEAVLAVLAAAVLYVLALWIGTLRRRVERQRALVTGIVVYSAIICANLMLLH